MNDARELDQIQVEIERLHERSQSNKAEIQSHEAVCEERYQNIVNMFQRLEKRLDKKHHAVIVVTEGVSGNLTQTNGIPKKDASGNILHEDIGLLLKETIKKYFQEKKIPISLKYIDPSYMIRSLPADSNDSAFCLMLGQNAVHAGMSGRTNMIVGYINRYFVHVPISLAISKRKKIDPNGHLWQTVLETTGQPCTRNGTGQSC